MSYANFNYEVHEHLARITINRPKAYNALDLPSMEELCDIVNHCSSDRRVRAVLLTGSGSKAFCAGGDVAGFAAAGETVDVLMKQMTGYLHMAISRLAWMDAPVLAAINGVAAGAGLSLAAACDLAIAVDHASFASAYSSIGLSPDGSSTWFLPRLIGRRRAMELFLSSRTLSAAEAVDLGLINQALPQADFSAAVESLATKLASGPTRAHAGVKKLMMLSANDTLESQMERESRQIAELTLSADGRDGARAFIEKRKPQFVGR
jgi:2-(1,2-epoxy-1,2-dihydrophenyl)acetyl-CoA isomerase